MHRLKNENVAKLVHGELCLKYKHSKEQALYCKYTIGSVFENNVCRNLLTDRNIQHNRPVFDKIENRMLLIDIAIPASTKIEKSTCTNKEIPTFDVGGKTNMESSSNSSDSHRI